MRITSLLCLFGWLAGPLAPLKAQIVPGSFGYYQDAIRFSRSSFSGTARFQGLAGAHTAVGGDISNTHNNPAGLGYIRNSEFTLSPGLVFAHTDTEYFSLDDETAQNTRPDSRANFNIAHAGGVFSLQKEDREPGRWRGGTVAISAARINNFHNQLRYEGLNQNTSKSDFYVSQTNGIWVADLQNLDLPQYEYQRAAYFAFLTNPFDYIPNPNNPNELIADPENTDYFTLARDEEDNLLGPVLQSETITTRGAQYQWAFAAAGNYDDRLFFGLNVHLAALTYGEKRTYREEIQNEASFLSSFEELNDLELSGTGLGASLGVLYRPLDLLRIGASFTTPTLYFMRESFNTRFTANVFDFADPNLLLRYEEETLPGEFDYRLRTPWRATAGLALFFKEYGFLAADAEYVAYPSARLRNNEFAGLLDADNQTLQNVLKPTWNIRLAGEARLKSFRLRAGYALEADPTRFEDGIDRRITRITGGLGIRQYEWYADIGLIFTRFNSAYVPYSFGAGELYAGQEPFTQTQNQAVNIVITGGVFF